MEKTYDTAGDIEIAIDVLIYVDNERADQSVDYNREKDSWR